MQDRWMMAAAGGDAPRDHGGDLDAAVARYGGAAEEWLDLSTGINPVAYPLPALPARVWERLPDREAQRRLDQAARRFWGVPDGAAVLAGPGTSALIARLPGLMAPGRVTIPGPTYNEHAAAFRAAGWTEGAGGAAFVAVHPNNPDGRLWRADELSDAGLLVIDESFGECVPGESLIAPAARPGVIVLKGLGKFWGLAGVRLGFAMGDPALIARLAAMMGPWPVSGPALAIGAAALADSDWAAQTRARLAGDAARLDDVMANKGARVIGGTTLFRLFEVDNAAAWQDRLARAHILTRAFPYDAGWLRLGLPGDEAGWARLEAAL